MARISLGLDVGHHQVRAVVLSTPRTTDKRDGKRARVMATACVDRLGLDGSSKPLSAVLEEIETLLSRRGPATAHFSDVNALVRFVPTIALPPDKRQRLLRLELLQHADEHGDLAADAWEVPVPGEEIIHGCIIGQPGPILTSLAAVRAAKLPQPAISYGPAAIANAIEVDELPPEQYTLVVDIGSTTTGLTLMGDGHLLACRQVPIGGDSFTEALMANGLDRSTAEQRKRGHSTPLPPAPTDLDLDLDGPAASPMAIAQPRDELQLDSLFELDDEPVASAPIAVETATNPPATSATAPVDFLGFDEPEAANSPAIETPAPAIQAITEAPAGATVASAAAVSPTTTTLSPDLQRNAEVFYSQLASSVLWFKAQLRLDKVTIGKVWLAGGGAALPGLDAYLSKRFHAPVAINDPFARLAIAQPPADPAAWTTAIGLAFSDPALGGKKVITLDVRPESLVRADFRRRHQIWPYVAAACLVLTTAVAGFNFMHEQSAQAANLQKLENWKKEHAKLTAELNALTSESADLSEDLRTIASRVYAGRDLLFTVRAMKELTKSSPELWVTRLETKGVGTEVQPTDSLRNVPATPNKINDSSVGRGAVLVSGKVKFSSALTDTGRDQFLKTWRESIASWKPNPEAPTLFKEQRLVEWDLKHQGPGGKPLAGAEEGEFPFKVEFVFLPTALSQITATQEQPEAGK